jgi:hypothetical protein
MDFIGALLLLGGGGKVLESLGDLYVEVWTSEDRSKKDTGRKWTLEMLELDQMYCGGVDVSTVM